MVKNPSGNAGDVRNAGSIPGSEDPLEEGMATHSTILAWRIQWTEEPGGLLSVRHDGSNLAHVKTKKNIHKTDEILISGNK